MKWEGRRESGNVEDRRGARPGRIAVGGGIGAVVMVVLALIFGVDPTGLIDTEGGGTTTGPVDPRQEEVKRFISVTLADTEDVWRGLFRGIGKTYRDPTLVLFSGQVQSACGFAGAAMGPFYCPEDGKVYIDLEFFEELSSRFGAPGDFAMAYVLAHEVGHHVQRLLGTTDRVHRMKGRVSDVEYNRLSVRLELQTDFFAGVWAHHAQRLKNILEEGDLEEALRAASAIGDDRLQRQARGRVVPDAFTHGTSAQRARWFRKGFETGDISQGDTFEIDYARL